MGRFHDVCRLTWDSSTEFFFFDIGRFHGVCLLAWDGSMEFFLTWGGSTECFFSFLTWGLSCHGAVPWSFFLTLDSSKEFISWHGTVLRSLSFLTLDGSMENFFWQGVLFNVSILQQRIQFISITSIYKTMLCLLSEMLWNLALPPLARSCIITNINECESPNRISILCKDFYILYS